MAQTKSAAIIDLETLGTSADSIITSVGVAFVDPHVGKQWKEGCQAFGTVRANYWVLGVKEQELRGRTISSNTAIWWMKQSEEAKAEMYKSMENLESVRWKLEEIATMLKIYANTVWGNGSVFDIVLLEDLYRSYDMEPPWSYKGVRCLRTLWNEFPPDRKLPKPVNPCAHHAMNDAIVEAQVLQQIYTTWKPTLVEEATEPPKVEAGVQLELDLGV